MNARNHSDAATMNASAANLTKPSELFTLERTLIGCILRDPSLLSAFTDLGGSPAWCASASARTCLEVSREIIGQHGVTPSLDALLYDACALRHPAVLTFLEGCVTTERDVEGFESIVATLKMEYLRREGRKSLLQAEQELAKAGADGVGPVLQQAVTNLEKISVGVSNRRYEPFSMTALFERGLDTLDQRLINNGVFGTPFGLRAMDEVVGGSAPGDYTVIAARPSMGKTTLTLQMALHQAVVHDAPSLYFGAETTPEQIALKILAGGGVDQRRLRSGQLDDEDWNRVTVLMNKMKSSPFEFIPASGMTLSEFVAIVRRHKRCRGLATAWFDHLGLFNMEGASYRGNRAMEIAEITGTFKSLAMGEGLHMVSLSQLNRDLERRSDKRPLMADLRDSGSIEQDADNIVFIYRDEIYNPDTLDKGMAELIFAKVRFGEIGTRKLRFEGRHSRFVDLSPNYGQEQSAY